MSTHSPVQRLCVFCGSSPGKKPQYLEMAKAFGIFVAEQKITLVYGGAKVGVMGAVADAALRAGGEVYGVIPRHLQEREVAHDGLTKLYIVNSMHERKAKMAELSDAFVALPGGAGTLEELFEIWTWAQLGLHVKPCGLLNTDGYYNHLIAMINHMTDEGFLGHQYKAMMHIADTPEQLLKTFQAYAPPQQKWDQQEMAKS